MSQITIDTDLRASLADALEEKKVFVITDENVYKLLDGRLIARHRIFILQPGENSKSFETVERILSELLRYNYDRTTTIVSIGGGVVGDIGGFVSGIYMRGVEWINVPTTLLAQVDSSVGGKCAINLSNRKNAVGLFKEPEEIYISLHYLASLSEDQWLSGMGEIVKTCFLSNELYNYVQPNFEYLKVRNPGVVKETISKCVQIKKKITDADLLEKGPRKVLNIGHTIGHALEAADGYRKSHGEYVLWGLKIENMLNKSIIEPSFYLKMQTLVTRTLLKKDAPNVSIDAIVETCLSDKKNTDETISIMTTENFGKVKETRFKPKQLKKELKKCL